VVFLRTKSYVALVKYFGAFQRVLFSSTFGSLHSFAVGWRGLADKGELLMALVVVGGHTRNIGKTSVVAGLIKALQDRAWTAIKITQFGHGICSVDGKSCDCATADHQFAITEERSGTTGTDTSRYLGAGALRSIWVRTQQGALLDAMPRVRAEMACGENIIIESNSILRFLKPDLFISVLDPAVSDFKGSARRYLDRADAILMPAAAAAEAAPWVEELGSIMSKARVLHFAPPVYVTEEIVDFVGERLGRIEVPGVLCA